MKQIEKRLTIEIDENLKQEFKVEVTRQGSTLRETLESLISSYIKKYQQN